MRFKKIVRLCLEALVLYNCEDTINYGEIIKALRKKHNLTQSELGQSISVGKTAISNYETGYSIPSAKVMEKIASAFGLTFLEFLTYGSEPSNLTNAQMPRYAQGSAEIILPYIKEENVREEILSASNYMDSTLVLPSFMLNEDKGYICVKVPDSSMSDEGIRKNDYVVIRKCSIIDDKQIALVLNTGNGKYTIRRYIREGHIASLIPNSSLENYPVIRIDERDERFKIVGYVEKIISSVK